MRFRLQFLIDLVSHRIYLYYKSEMALELVRKTSTSYLVLSDPKVIDEVIDEVLPSPQQGTKCRFCYDQRCPLAQICDCSGTMAYVHQKCIMDWIAHKWIANANLEALSCEICQSRFDTNLVKGPEGFCFRLLVDRVKQLQWKIVLFVLGHSILVFSNIYIILSSLLWASQNYQEQFLQTGIKAGSSPLNTVDGGLFTGADYLQIASNVLMFLLSKILLQSLYLTFVYFGYSGAVRDFLGRCRIQVLSITIIPRKVIKK